MEPQVLSVLRPDRWIGWARNVTYSRHGYSITRVRAGTGFVLECCHLSILGLLNAGISRVLPEAMRHMHVIQRLAAETEKALFDTSHALARAVIKIRAIEPELADRLVRVFADEIERYRDVKRRDRWEVEAEAKMLATPSI